MAWGLQKLDITLENTLKLSVLVSLPLSEISAPLCDTPTIQYPITENLATRYITNSRFQKPRQIKSSSVHFFFC